MTNVESLTPYPLPIGFDFEHAAGEFKQALVESYCCGSVSAFRVTEIFSASVILKKA